MRHGIIFCFVIGWLCSVVIAPAYAQWVHTSYDYDVTAIGSVGSNLFVGDDAYEADIYLSTNDGTSWSPVINSSFGNLVYDFATMGTKIFAATDDGIYLSTDTGNSWNRLDLDHQCFAIKVIGPNLFAGSSDSGVYLSTDSGTSWTTAYNGLPIQPDANQSVQDLASSGTTLIAGVTNGGIFISTNNGLSWTGPPKGDTDSNYTNISHVAAVGTTLFFSSFERGVFRSTDNGVTWIPANNGLTDHYIYAFYVVGNDIFAGTLNKGVFLSTDTGSSWSPVNEGLTDLGVYCLGVSDGYLYDGDLSTVGVWRRPLSQMISSSAVVSTPPASQSISGYPNPFTQSSTITFSCASSGVGEVIIVNLLGAPVARLFSGELGAGEHSFSWDASGVAAGVYECVVRVNGNAQRIPLAVVR